MSTVTNATATTGNNIGHITQVIGSTFDVEFDEDHLPAIYNAVKIDSEHKGVKINLTGEVQQHLGGSRVRCVALGSTDGLVRGMDVRRHRRAGQGAGRQGHARPRVQPARASRSTAAVRSMPTSTGRSTATPPTLDRSLDQDRAVRDRHQGHRPAHAVRPRRQGRSVRRCRSGQDGYSHRADRPYRQSRTAVTRCSPASASEPAKGTTSGWKCRKPRSATPAAASSSKRAWCSAR